MTTRTHPSFERLIGVEEELLLVDPETGVPVPRSGAVLATAHAESGPADEGSTPTTHLEAELKREQIEVVSAPCATLSELAVEVAAGRRLADVAARAAGARAVALGTSPAPVDSHLMQSSRFRSLAKQYPLTTREQLTCGLHVHVTVSDDEEGVAVIDRVRPWLPVLLALSANSPLWQGVDTGFASYRHQVWGRWPSAGSTEVFGSAAAYHGIVERMVETGALLDRGMVYFDARLSDRYPTVEIRVSDVCMSARRAVGIAGIVRGLVETEAAAWRRGEPLEAVPTTLVRLAMWTASRFGLEAELIHPVEQQPRPAAEAVEALLDHVSPALEETGDLAEVRGIVAEILREGTGAERQRSLIAQGASYAELVSDAVAVTHRPVVREMRPAQRRVYIRHMRTKEIDGIVYTLTRRDAPGPDLDAWYWLGADGSVAELDEAEHRALRVSEVILDE